MDIEVVDPEVRPALKKTPAPRVDTRWGRAVVRTATRLFLRPAIVDGVTTTVIQEGGARLRLYRPDSPSSDAALLWIHGGGLVIGTPLMDDRFCAETARELGIVVASVDYRLAPEHPFPLPLDDCAAAWDWLQTNAARLGVGPGRVAIGGQSAGGGLAAALVQRIHDAGHDIRAQWLFCPMLDDRTAARRELDAIDHWVWNNRANLTGWSSYLADEPGADAVPAYASPSRREDLTGLPPAWISVGDIELFHDEDVDYARRLEAAGVPVTLDITPGAPHGFESWAPRTELAKALIGRARTWLSGALELTTAAL